MLLKPSVMSKPERKITEGLKIQFKVLLPEVCSKLGGPDALAHWRPVQTFEARFVHVARGPTFANFSHLAFVRRPGVATTPCVSPRRGVVRTHPHSSSGRGVPTTPPSIVGRGVLTMPPRVVRTSWRRHDAPPVPRRQLRFSDGSRPIKNTGDTGES